jgi:iron complex outermembrane receptor protein
MKKILIVINSTLCICTKYIKHCCKNSETKEPLIGENASIKGTSIGGTSERKGQIILSNIPDGIQEIHFSYEL